MRALTRVGRAVAVVFLLWVVGLILAGLGILPAGDVPLGHALAPQAPPPLSAAPHLRQPSASDLTPAQAVGVAGAASTQSAARAAGGQRSALTPTAVRQHQGSGTSHGGGSSSGTGAGQGNPTAPLQIGNPSPPGRTQTSTPGNSGSAPGHVKSTTAPTMTGSPGKSGAAPGHVKTTATPTTSSPGNSGAAPGHTVTHGNGHGSGG